MPPPAGTDEASGLSPQHAPPRTLDPTVTPPGVRSKWDASRAGPSPAKATSLTPVAATQGDVGHRAFAVHGSPFQSAHGAAYPDIGFPGHTGGSGKGDAYGGPEKGNSGQAGGIVGVGARPQRCFCGCGRGGRFMGV